MISFEQAKQQVAAKRLWNSTEWENLEGNHSFLMSVVNEAAELYAQAAANEAVRKEQDIEKLTSRLADVVRLLLRKSNTHPEIFSDLDKMRIGAAQGTMERYVKPFDVREVLRGSDEPLPYTE